MSLDCSELLFPFLEIIKKNLQIKIAIILYLHGQKYFHPIMVEKVRCLVNWLIVLSNQYKLKFSLIQISIFLMCAIIIQYYQRFSALMKDASSDQIYKIIPQLKISPEGQFKYILIKCRVNNHPQPLLFVRGDKKFSYHADNYDQFVKEIKKAGFTDIKKKEEKISAKKDGDQYDFICPGGGRIQHNYEGKKCSVYGYSQSYGYVDHSEAQKIISQHLHYPMDQIKLNEKDY